MKSIRSTHTIITILIAVILSALFMVSFPILITPNDKQALEYDQKRENDFKSLDILIKNYYAKKEKLPESLGALSEDTSEDKLSLSTYHKPKIFNVNPLDYLTMPIISIQKNLETTGKMINVDPYLNRPYTYKFENSSSTKYQLCTKFFKENKGEEDDVKRGSSSEVKHGSGEQCVDFKVSKKKTSEEWSAEVERLKDRYDSGDISEKEFTAEYKEIVKSATSGYSDD